MKFRICRMRSAMTWACDTGDYCQVASKLQLITFSAWLTWGHVNESFVSRELRYHRTRLDHRSAAVEFLSSKSQDDHRLLSQCILATSYAKGKSTTWDKTSQTPMRCWVYAFFTTCYSLLPHCLFALCPALNARQYPHSKQVRSETSTTASHAKHKGCV